MDPELLKILNSIQEDTKSLRSTSEQVQKDINCMKIWQSTHSNKVKAVEKDMVEVQHTLSDQSKSERAKNLLLFNVQDNEDTNGDLLATVSYIFEKAGVNIPEISIATAYRLGQYTTGKDRPILIKFLAPRWKKPIFEKIMEFKKMKINIANDIPIEDRSTIKDLLKVRYILKQEGKISYIKDTTLLYNNHPLSRDEIDNILRNSDVIPANTSVPTTSHHAKSKTPSTPEALSGISTYNFVKATNTVKAKGPGRPRVNSSSSQADNNNTLDEYITVATRSSKAKNKK